MDQRYAYYFDKGLSKISEPIKTLLTLNRETVNMLLFFIHCSLFTICLQDEALGNYGDALFRAGIDHPPPPRTYSESGGKFK